VIAVVMGDQNFSQFPAGFLQRRLDRRRLRRVDGRGGAGLRIVQQDAEIVLQAGKEIGLRRHWLPPKINHHRV
jgi:hypothetical protein